MLEVRFGKRVGEHFISGTINDLEGTMFDDPSDSDEVESDVNVFSACVVPVVFSELNRDSLSQKRTVSGVRTTLKSWLIMEWSHKASLAM